MKSMDWARKSWQRKAGAGSAPTSAEDPQKQENLAMALELERYGVKIFNYRLNRKHRSSSGRHRRRRRLSHTANLERLELGGGPPDVLPRNPTLGFRSGKRTA